MDINFEYFLQEKHDAQYIGISDDAPDDFSDWLMDLDPQELIDYGQEYARKMYMKGVDKMADRAIKSLNN